jgi:hypothetical protein
MGTSPVCVTRVPVVLVADPPLPFPSFVSRVFLRLLSRVFLCRISSRLIVHCPFGQVDVDVRYLEHTR